MKKASAIFFILLFLLANSGIAVNVHYCRGKISSVKFFVGDNHSCTCNHKKMKPGCCKDKATILKANDDLSKANSVEIKNPGPTIKSAFNPPVCVMPTLPGQIYRAGFYHPPPCPYACPIYLLDGVFLI